MIPTATPAPGLPRRYEFGVRELLTLLGLVVTVITLAVTATNACRGRRPDTAGSSSG